MDTTAEVEKRVAETGRAPIDVIADVCRDTGEPWEKVAGAFVMTTALEQAAKRLGPLYTVREASGPTVANQAHGIYRVTEMHEDATVQRARRVLADPELAQFIIDFSEMTTGKTRS